MTTQLTLSIGDLVRYSTLRRTDPFDCAYGRIIAIEKYTDSQASKVWYYVRWISPDGKPDSEPQKCDPDELVHVEGDPAP